jgi:signal transduction histidine kinase
MGVGLTAPAVSAAPVGEGAGWRRLAHTTAFRIAWMAVGVLGVCSAAVGLILSWQTNKLVGEEVVAALRGETATLMAVAQTGGPAAIAEAVRIREREPGGGLYLLLDREGVKLAGNLAEPPAGFAPGSDGAVFHYRPPGGDADLAGIALVQSTPDGGRLYVGRDIEESRAFARRLGRMLFLGFLALTLAGLVGAVAVGRLVLRRIGAMTAASQVIMAGDLSGRIPLDGSGDELDELAGSLNAMLARIEMLMQGLREVSDNIAHDLKTPLNRLRHHAEAALRDPGEATHRQALERVIEDADDLIKTFNALLLVARLEAGAIEGNTEDFDLGALVGDVAELYAPVAEEHGMTVSAEITAAPSIRANRQLIGQAVANLIDNAIKYGRGAIDLRVTRGEDGGFDLSVADHGAGIAAADRERAVKRFVRLDESRTRSGTGLGLSLVAAVARLHGGTLRLEDNAPGLRVVVALPGRLVV